MTKNMMKSLVAYLNGETVANIAEIKASLEAELAKGEAKAQANRDLYAAAHDVVMTTLSNKPMTMAELWEAVKGNVPEGMTKSKVQYALRELWAAEVVKIEGKVNEYKRA